MSLYSTDFVTGNVTPVIDIDRLNTPSPGSMIAALLYHMTNMNDLASVMACLDRMIALQYE